MKNKYLLTALFLTISVVAFAIPVEKFDTITTNSPSKVKIDSLKGIKFTSTDSIKLPVGTTAQRDGSPVDGMFRLNSTTAKFEGYISSAWENLLSYTTSLLIPVQTDLNSHKIINLTDPTSAQDASTKKYVDDTVAAISFTNYVDRTTTQSIGGDKTFTGNNTFSNIITGSVTGNAATVTTNANLTGHIVSVGNSSTLGAFSSSNLSTALTDETGSGSSVFATSPTLVTPALGVATATSINGTSIPSSKTLVVTTDKLSVQAATSSSELAGVISDETGTGLLVFGTSPTLVTPALGTPSALVGTNITGTASGLTAGHVTTNANLTGHIVSTGNSASLGSFASADLSTALSDETGSGVSVFSTYPTIFGLTLLSDTTASTINGTTIPSTKTLVVTTDKLSVHAATTSSELAGVISDETGTNKLVYSDSPTLVSPALGTPTALVGTNITGTAAGLTAGSVTAIPNLTGHIVSTGNATLLGSFSSSNLLTALNDETGTGVSVFATSPTLVTPNIGVASATSLAVGGTKSANAVADFQSTTQGFIPPRMTTAQRITLGGLLNSTTDKGTTVLDTDINAYSYWTGTSWSTGLGTVSVDTDWVACTFANLTWQGIGGATPVTNNLQCRRNGQWLEYRGSVTIGTVSANAAQFPLPTNYGTITTSTFTGVESYGLMIKHAAAAAVLFNPIAASGQAYFNSSGQMASATVNPATVQNGNSSYTLGDVLVFSNVRIPISQWSSTTTTYSAASANTNPLNYTPTLTGVGTTSPTTNQCKYWIDGTKLNGACSFTLGTNSAAIPSLTLPSPYVIDTTKMIAANTTGQTGQVVGTYGQSQTGVAGYVVTATGTSTSTIYLAGLYSGTSVITPAASASAILQSSALISINFSVPISNSNASQAVAVIPNPATLSDVKSNGTAGGSSSAGATQTRTLNTIVDTSGIVTSLSSNQFTLPAGTYYIEASAPSTGTTKHRARIRNITDGTTALLGTSETMAVGTLTNKSFISGEIVITASKAFELQHYTNATQSTNGLGDAASSGESEVYSVVKITKLK